MSQRLPDWVKRPCGNSHVADLEGYLLNKQMWHIKLHQIVCAPDKLIILD